MPTGYTSAIKDGISFKEFALNCARAFGACITMRDDPSDKPIPKEFKVSDYHEKEIKKTKEELKILEKITIKEATEKAKQVYQRAIKSNKKELERNNNLRKKYEEMLAQVRNWHPPTVKHLDFKKFMIDQIKGSISFDCGDEYYLENKPILLTGLQWIEETRRALIEDLNYHAKGDKAEKSRVIGRNDWIKKLRESLK